jgi:hypothetical protein
MFELRFSCVARRVHWVVIDVPSDGHAVVTPVDPESKATGPFFEAVLPCTDSLGAAVPLEEKISEP